MTGTGLVLGAISLLAEPELRRTKVRLRDIPIGLASAAGLYAIFYAGDRMARRILPKGGDQIGEVYDLRQLRPTPELAARLALVIGPAEELFWRGLLQRRFSDHLGPWPAAATAAAAYAGAHIAARNFTLFGAAGVAGAFWSGLAAAGVPLGALIVSHIAWDLWIFLIAPTATSS
jgi:CAAX protease family protein